MQLHETRLIADFGQSIHQKPIVPSLRPQDSPAVNAEHDEDRFSQAISQLNGVFECWIITASLALRHPIKHATSVRIRRPCRRTCTLEPVSFGCFIISGSSMGITDGTGHLYIASQSLSDRHPGTSSDRLMLNLRDLGFLYRLFF